MRGALQVIRVLLALTIPGVLYLGAINHDAEGGRVALVFGLMLTVALLFSAVSALITRLTPGRASEASPPPGCQSGRQRQ